MNTILKVHNYLESIPEVGKVQSLATLLKLGKTLNKGEELDVHFTGGGGTDLDCVCEHAENAEETEITIIFTDGYFCKFSHY